MRTWNSFLTVALLSTAACGGGHGGDDASTPDGHVVDGFNDDATPTATRAMTIAVTDVKLTSTQAVAAGLRGGVIDISFSNLTQGGGQVVFGTSPIGSCVVTKFDATHAPNELVDAGTVNIEAPATGTNGLLKPVGPCTFLGPDVGYRCVSNSAASGETINGTATGANGVVLYAFPNQSFSGNLVGSYLSVNGFGNGFDSGTSAFPIIGQPDAHTLTVINGAATSTGTTTTGAFLAMNGAGPIPTAGGANASFLSDQATSVRVQKDADADWGAIDFTTFVRGDGFALDDNSARPEAFPSVAQDVTFSCSGPNGNCGGDDTTNTSVIRATIVSGRTTDGATTNLPDYVMPDPVTSYTTFECGFIWLGANEPAVKIPSAAVAQILATNPSRIETRVLQVAGATMPDSQNALNQNGIVLVGHGLVGHTSIPQ